MSLSVIGLEKNFGTNKAVDNLNFEMLHSGVFGLLGTNGAGKTTSIRMIMGMMNKDGGRAAWNGEEISLASVGLGYMPEERGIYPKITVIEQLVYFATLRGMKAKEADIAAQRWLERLGVAEYKNKQAEKLSKGNQQKIQLIAALINDPSLIFMDEPFSGLDPINAGIFKSVIDELIKKGKFIIMSSHQMSTVEEYCEELLILDRGKTVLQGNLNKIKKSYKKTNLSIKCEQDIALDLKKYGLTLKSKTGIVSNYSILDEKRAYDFIKECFNSNIFIESFDMREPSLNEIFIEKVNAAV